MELMRHACMKPLDLYGRCEMCLSVCVIGVHVFGKDVIMVTGFG